MKLNRMWGIWLVVLGGINWGLVGLGHFLNMDLNVVHLLLSASPAAENIVYVIIGVAAVWVASMEMGRR